MEGAGFADNVQFLGEIAGGIPGFFRVAAKDAGEVFAFHDEAEAAAFDGDEGGGPVHYFAHGGPFIADDHRVGDGGAEPVEEVEDLGAGYTREEVFVAARTADDFVRKDGADDEDGIVIEEESIDFDRDIHGEEPTAQVVDFCGGDYAEGGEGLRIVPGMVEKAGGGVGRPALIEGNFEALADGLLVHGRVGAESDNDVERGGSWVELAVEFLKDRSDRSGAGEIGDDAKDSLAIPVVAGQKILEKGGEVFRGDGSPGGGTEGKSRHC